MKYSLFIFCFILFSFSTSDFDWKLKKEKKGIKIFTKSVSDSDIKEFRAEMTVNTTLDEVSAIILDGNHLHTWIHKVTESKTVKSISNDKRIVWFAMDLPWPVKNRDQVSELTVIKLSDKVMKIQILPDTSNTHPEQKKYIRVHEFRGYWLLEQQNDAVKITQNMYVNPGVNLPSWFLNSIIDKAPYQSFLNLKNKLSLIN